jgi:hypothetical protein
MCWEAQLVAAGNVKACVRNRRSHIAGHTPHTGHTPTLGLPAATGIGVWAVEAGLSDRLQHDVAEQLEAHEAVVAALLGGCHCTAAGRNQKGACTLVHALPAAAAPHVMQAGEQRR